MGIFDIFTGDSAKKAAQENEARLQQLQTTGLGYLDTGKAGAIGALDQAGGLYAPLAAKYGKGSDLYLNALGVNGPQGNQAATQAFHAGPGYQYAVDQALQNTSRQANANGALLSGNTLAALSDRAGNMANQEYGGWLDRLGGLISPEMAATGGEAGYAAAKAPVYTNDANSRVNLASGVTTGINDQNTQAANAAMQGSGNLWNFGLNLAKLGVGAATGGAGGFGTSLLGGGSNPAGGSYNGGRLGLGNGGSWSFG